MSQSRWTDPQVDENDGENERFMIRIASTSPYSPDMVNCLTDLFTVFSFLFEPYEIGTSCSSVA